MPKGDFVGEFEICVLAAIGHLGDGAYGLAIRKEIADRTGRDPAIGAVYATIGRLTDKGLVDSRRSDPLPIRGGRYRNCLYLTPDGQQALTATTEMLARMLAGWKQGPERG
jgi:DNA-binding PadR family transcriptional regulator